ncbi:MAG: thrombospondin type 3 repeat-containing protein [Nannocystaceae bacterium]|nr:thrombospondin type 3 repeat-containing protein [Nannocystaceae bacterium]
MTTVRRRTVVLVAASLASLANASCLEDVECGVCDEKNLVLQIMSGTNYAGELVHLVSPQCEGPRCPEPFTRARRFVETLGPCEETDAALASPRGPQEYCRIAPIVVADGLQFVFNNLLADTSVELVRKRPDVPGLFEVYDWKTKILSLQGPVTRYSGQWRHDDTDDRSQVTGLVNHSCEANLAAQGLSGADVHDASRCDALGPDGLPLRLQADQVVTAARGKWEDRAIGEAVGYDCETPADGVDTCCSVCDHALGVRVAKYGAGERIACDPDADRLVACAAFEVATDRSDEVHCDPADERCKPFALQQADAVRELHPDRRGELETPGAACETDDQCRDVSGQGLPGAECVGTDDSGRACSPQAGDPSCTAGRCRAPWFVRCAADPDTTGAQGYCVDVRHDSDAAAACWVGSGFQVCDGEGGCAPAQGDTRLSSCDADADGHLTAAECCPDGAACDPVYDTAVSPMIRYERKSTLPSITRELNCGDTFVHAVCDDVDCCDGDVCTAPASKGGGTCRLSTGHCEDCPHEVEAVCAVQDDRLQTCEGFEDSGDYVVNLVTKLGGVIYDPALKGLKWLPADRGGRPRAVIEACAQSRGLIAPRNVADGWRAHDDLGMGVELEADYDLGLCSGQQYSVVFEVPAAGEAREVLRDKVGNTLEGKQTYLFETPHFHVVPDSGFPADNLRIGPCDTFSLSFSNKYDLSPGNLAKIELHEVQGSSTVRVAGGRDCVQTGAALDATPGAVPCLSPDVSDHDAGVLHVRLDPVEFGSYLRTGTTYRLVTPGLESADQASDAAAYAAAFWDVCGMPLVLGDLVAPVAGGSSTSGDSSGGTTGGDDGSGREYEYTFKVDETRCEEDEDGDGVSLSCDNAPDLYNPEQSDVDRDGVGDALDPCPASPLVARNTGDSDRDGVGNACDSCARASSRYNELASTNAVPTYLQVRAVPSQADADDDGIGDVCDNCPATANCSGYGVERPFRLDDALDPDAATCQRDADEDMIGDECLGAQGELAAGAVGFGDFDDFDQDGLPNLYDGCPRQPERDRIACSDDAGCPDGRACTFASGADEGVCNHLDGDDDGVGDVCDTCPSSPNAMQAFDGGAQVDDPDGDFVGGACELADACAQRPNPRPLGFFRAAAAGQCCTTLLVEQDGALFERSSGEPLVDADGVPITRSCGGSGCRALPDAVAALPGVLVLPAGCDAALAEAGLSLDDNRPLLAADTSGDLDALWNLQCRLPALDQDYDGLGDECDLCPFAFDPSNEPYTDAAGKLWSHDGAACSGDNSPRARCDEGAPDEPDDTTGGAGESSSSDGG